MKSGGKSKEKLNEIDMYLYILEHNGHYLGGVIVVVEDNHKAAKDRIEQELLSRGVSVKDFDLEKVKHIETDKPKTVYVDDGNY